MTLGTKLFTMFCGEQVGADSQGNCYYRNKRRSKSGREIRWISYDGKVEASRIPPAWHSWLHHTTDKLPVDDITRLWEWQKEHLPNWTGTENSYCPPGHILKGGERGSSTGDYEPWQPT